MKLLLHCCCAPCAISSVKSLRAENIELDLFWFNPNIHPYAEFVSRRGGLSQFAANENINLKMIDEYGLRVFLDAVYPNIEDRCGVCYYMRLEKTAAGAAQNGYNAFTTTLLISPYQKHDEIRRIGEEAGIKYGVDFLYRDFRPVFRESQTAARTGGFYMQKYCGCIFSEEKRETT
jgi:predicted adenine nucleotide alpha hydrolase (AANH) superfamily ATPase